MMRRRFLVSLSSLFGSALVARAAALERFTSVLQAGGAGDEEIALRVFSMMARRGASEDPIGDVMVAIGSSFTGTPYVAHSLEVPGIERLVVNLRGFDCTTFVESVLAMARSVRLRTASYESFQQQLTLIRYRGGEIKGYPSRLHYFTEWIADNEKKGILRDITQDLGGVAVTKPIDFMTTHRDAYRQLKDPTVVAAIAEVEHRLSARPLVVIGRQRVAAVQDQLCNGDIIGLVTAVKGLDFSHTGLVVRSGAGVRYLHAPLSAGAVQISERPLAELVAANARVTGIAVARPLEPNASLTPKGS